MTPPAEDVTFAAQVAAICPLYGEAPALAAQGERVYSTDEMTGVQALERKHAGLPMQPGHVERREFEYICHGTLAAIISRDVVSGQITAPTLGPTRTEADFVGHLAGVVRGDRTVSRWHFVVDNLNIHCSESLVRYVAELSGITEDLGVKDKHGILHNCASRSAFLSDPTPKVVFHYTLKHSSWLNQIEMWLGILVRKLRKRGSFTLVTDVETKIRAFIDYYNRTMAKPFAWTYRGKALVA